MQIEKYLTIVIPCKNEEQYIERTLDSINNQIGIDDIQVYIADADSTDHTRDIVENFIRTRAIFNINIIDGGMVSKGRNNGLNLVTTPYILFMDADTVLCDINTIKTYLNKMVDCNLDLIAAPIKNISRDFKATIMFEVFNYSNHLLSLIQPFSVGMFFMARTELVRGFGGFDESLIHSEDFILSKKFKKTKFRIGQIKVGQDNRRFKRFGYSNMIKMILTSFLNQRNISFFQKDNGYWK